MDISETREGGTAVLALEGRLDTGSAPGAEARLLAALGEGGVVADLGAVPYVSSAGLRALLKAAKAAGVAKHGFALCGLRPEVREVFEISGFDAIIPIHVTRADAVASLAKRG